MSSPPNARAGALEAGQPLVGKISGIKVYTQASKASAGILVLSKADEVIYMGEEREGPVPCHHSKRRRLGR